MPPHTRKAIVLLLACLALQPLLCPLEGAPQQIFDDVVEVVQVEVPVNVIQDGAPVRGLARDDFKLIAAGKKREIVGFSIFDLAEIQPRDQDTGVELSLAGRRHFMLLFDLSFSKPSSIVRARHAAIELVERGMHPTDLIGVAAYSSRSFHQSQ